MLHLPEVSFPSRCPVACRYCFGKLTSGAPERGPRWPQDTRRHKLPAWKEERSAEDVAAAGIRVGLVVPTLTVIDLWGTFKFFKGTF